MQTNEQVSKLCQAVNLVLQLPPGAMCDPTFADVMRAFDAKEIPMRSVSALHSLLDGGKIEKIQIEVD